MHAHPVAIGLVSQLFNLAFICQLNEPLMKNERTISIFYFIKRLAIPAGFEIHWHDFKCLLRLVLCWSHYKLIHEHFAPWKGANDF